MNEFEQGRLHEAPKPDISEGLCLKAMLKLAEGRDVLEAECSIRRAGYAQASAEIYGGGEVPVKCAGKVGCEQSAVLLIEGGIVRVANTLM